ncbi:MAG: hypothetical protein J6T63_08140 [Bacteroidales bacterium]|nr:hypothetical protein [Bacteroidales bacterium]
MKALRTIRIVAVIFAFCGFTALVSCNKVKNECKEYSIEWSGLKEYVQLNMDLYKSATYDDFTCFDGLYDKCKSTEEKIKESCNTTVQHIHTQENPMNPDYPISYTETYHSYPGSDLVSEICENISKARKSVDIKNIDRRKSRFEKCKKEILKYADKVLNLDEIMYN